MEKKIMYVGIDVDDKNFHGTGFVMETGEIFPFCCKPTFGSLHRKLLLLKKEGYLLKVCYEATYIGFTLYRELLSNNIHCAVIAPSLIPVQSSSRVKTDRIDSLKLAEYYAKDLLTVVSIPSEEDEQVRRLIRSRSFLVNQRSDLKRHILSICRTAGVDYRKEKKAEANYWTVEHLQWLIVRIKSLPECDYWTLEHLVNDLKRMDSEISAYDEKIEEISKRDSYKKKCDALNAFKGLRTLSSMTLVVELGDIRRFPHPNKVVSYAGMDITEYSSGGKERKYGITKMGNRRIRTVLTEACQIITPATTVGKQLRSRRNDVSPQILDIVQRCQARLYKKKTKLTYAGKHVNKIKTACAREMVGFVWEALMALA